MQITVNHTIKVDLDPIEIINTLLNGYWIEGDKLMTEDYQLSYEVTNISKEKREYYTNLWKIKQYLETNEKTT